MKCNKCGREIKGASPIPGPPACYPDCPPKEKIKVELEIVHDKDTGLTMNVYKWSEGGEFKMQCDIANRPAHGEGASLPIRVLVWDEKIDGGMAEARRHALETFLNEEANKK